MSALFGSMSGLDRRPRFEEDVVCGSDGWTDCAARRDCRMRDLAIALAATRPWGCLKTCDRSAERLGEAGDWAKGRSKVIIVSRPLERGDSRGGWQIVGGQVNPRQEDSGVSRRRLALKEGGEGA